VYGQNSATQTYSDPNTTQSASNCQQFRRQVRYALSTGPRTNQSYRNTASTTATTTTNITGVGNLSKIGRTDRTYLKVPGGDAVWDAMTPFQHFLWYVDEMEYRWHAMQQYFDQEFGKGYNDNIDDNTPESNANNLPPNLLEVTWSTPEDLQDGINHVRTSLGCTPIPNVPMTHNHTKSQHEAINCTDYILQDWQYQDIMQYTAETRNILLRPDLLLPVHLDSDKCVETRQQLDQFVAEHMPSSPNKQS
jgi:hypothetical protein